MWMISVATRDNTVSSVCCVARFLPASSSPHRPTARRSSPEYSMSGFSSHARSPGPLPTTAIASARLVGSCRGRGQSRVSRRWVTRCGRAASAPRRSILFSSYDAKLPSNQNHFAGSSSSPSQARMWVADAVEEPPVVRGDHGAAGEVQQRVLERRQRLDVEVVGRLVEQQQVAAHLQRQREVEPVALTTGEDAGLLLLVGALEAERRDVGARVHLEVGDLDEVEPVGDDLPDVLLAGRGRRGSGRRRRSSRSCRP